MIPGIKPIIGMNKDKIAKKLQTNVVRSNHLTVNLKFLWIAAATTTDAPASKYNPNDPGTVFMLKQIK